MNIKSKIDYACMTYWDLVFAWNMTLTNSMRDSIEMDMVAMMTHAILSLQLPPLL